jgi:hypothetical protein
MTRLGDETFTEIARLFLEATTRGASRIALGLDALIGLASAGILIQRLGLEPV